MGFGYRWVKAISPPARRRGFGFPPGTSLSRDRFDGMIGMQGMLRAALDFLDENMARILLHTRRLMAAAVLLLLVGVVALSTATRKPCLHVLSGPWHTYKVGHMTPSRGHETSEGRPATVAESRPEIPPRAQSVSSFHVSREESIPPALAIVVQRQHLRAPPTLS